jgi:HEAT repeat protein
LAAVAAFTVAAAAHAQAGGDPVERLREVLQGSGTDVGPRDRATRDALAGLRSLGDLRRAVTLTEWRDRHPDPALAAVDAANRAAVTERFAREVREVLARPDPAAAGVGVDVLAEMGAAARAAGEPPDLTRPFAPDLARLAGGNAAPRLRAAAARALGQVGADPALAVPVFEELLRAREPGLRRAAADGLAGLVDGVAPQPPGRTGAAAGPRSGRGEAVAVACAALPAAGRGLGDWYVEVRRRCAGTVGAAAGTLARLISEGPAESGEGDSGPAALRPLALAVAAQAPALARALRDGDPEVRLRAHQALAEVAGARRGWLRAGGAGADDPFLDGLRLALPALADSAADPDLRVRRAALDVLELMGPAAAPAAPALARALQDHDRFVRWAAVRALAAVGPAAVRQAAAGMARLLEDEDLDVRLAAANALKQLEAGGPALPRPVTPAGVAAATPAAAARAALPGLIRSVRSGDRELRLAAIGTLRGLGADARPAVPALAQALAAPDAPVRLAAAEALGGLGPAGRDATDALRAALKDPSPEVRQAAGEALLAVTRAPRP